MKYYKPAGNRRTPGAPAAETRSMKPANFA